MLDFVDLLLRVHGRLGRFGRVARANADALTALADGCSCRIQASLVDGVRLRHPVQATLAPLRAARTLKRRCETP